MQFIGTRIFKHRDFQSKPQRYAKQFGAGHTKYQPHLICLDLFRAKNVFMWQSNCIAPTHRNPNITVTTFIARRINYSSPQITVTAWIVRWTNNSIFAFLEHSTIINSMSSNHISLYWTLWVTIIRGADPILGGAACSRWQGHCRYEWGVYTYEGESCGCQICGQIHMSFRICNYALGLPGPQWIGISLELGLIPSTFIF